MKKIFLFLLGCFATNLVSAQNITCDMFVVPANTGANMTVGVNASKFDQFADGGQIGAFYDLDGDGTLECVGLESVQTGFFGLALWGDDSSTPELDGLGSGDAPSFAICHNGNVLLVAEIPQFTGYVTNGIVNITDATIDGGAGCTDASACNAMFMYADVNYTDDASCTYPEPGYGCDGICINDADLDGVCDEDEVVGCQDETACNFNPNATDPGSCDYPDFAYDCDGNCISDADGDGVCDEFEVVGCQDDAYDNYDASATDAGTCSGLLGCTDSGFAEFYDGIPSYDDYASANGAGYEVDNGDCQTEIVTGCTNPAASNYDGAANLNIPEGEDGACVIEGVNFTCASDEENTSVAVTSNNMSVLFPVNNAGIWNSDVSNIQEGDLVAAVYETGRLEQAFVGYSAISGLQNGGSLCGWDGDQQGLAVFGADNGIVNGFAPGEELKWLVQREGVVYNATVTYATSGYDGTYQENTYVTANSIVIGSLFDEGCTDPNFMEFSPMATSDDGSCATQISIGCLDNNFVNYAGADVDVASIHDNATNYGNPFGENMTMDLNTGLLSNSGIAANFNDLSMCQTQVPGCTYPYASNYDSEATEDDGSCDWSSYTYYDFDATTGVEGDVMYTFGGDDDDSNNEWVGSDFNHANDLYQDGAMATGHIVTDLIAAYESFEDTVEHFDALLAYTLDSAAVAFAADEAADEALLAQTIADWTALYEFTLDSAATAFAEDEAADLLFLNNTIQFWTDSMDFTHADYQAEIAYLLDSAAVAFAADEAADEALLAATIAQWSSDYDSLDADWAQRYADNDAAHIVLEGLITDSLNYHRAPIEIDLHTGWNTVAYYLHHESPVVAQFEAQFGTEENVQDNINIVKNNEGLFYWPDFMFDGLGMLQPGQGYQVRVKDEATGNPAFIFDHAINRDDYRVLQSTVPSWALEMEIDTHPNDIRSLVRVVNMLGQEVNPEDQFAGEVLLYMYNDGTVEKKMVR